MRVALISDLHGNEVSLQAVLTDIARAGVDQIVCLGDTATLGPRPQAVLARLRDLGCPCILGNHDAFLLEPDLLRSYNETPVIVAAVDWCRDHLSAEDLGFLATFVPRLELTLEGGACLSLFHGSPRSHMEDLLCTTPPDTLDQMLGLGGQDAPPRTGVPKPVCRLGVETGSTIHAGGHTHVQMLRQHRGMLVVNPGSVGMPFERYVGGGPPTILPHAEWACVDAGAAQLSVSLHRVAVDPAALRRAALASDNPLAPMLASQY
jgi:predicted phosphodiesterase